MALSRSLCSVFLLYILVSAHAQVTISHLSGVWKTYFQSPSVSVLTQQGPALVCRDTLSPECEGEIILIEDSYSFNGTTTALEMRDRIAITTMEQSAAVHIECAKDGVCLWSKTTTVVFTKEYLSRAVLRTRLRNFML